jgi:hypothetical protein
VGAHLEGTELEDAHLQGTLLLDAGIGGAFFTYANLSLSDLRKLKWELLTQEDYNQLRDFLSKIIVDEEQRTEVLKRIETATRQNDTLGEAVIRDALCDEDLYAVFHPSFIVLLTTHYAPKLAPYRLRIQTCFMESDVTAYDAKLAPYFGELGCRDAYVASSIAKRIQGSRKIREEFINSGFNLQTPDDIRTTALEPSHAASHRHTTHEYPTEVWRPSTVEQHGEDKNLRKAVVRCVLAVSTISSCVCRTGDGGPYPASLGGSEGGD